MIVIWDGVITYTNASGCDSVHTLNLTINYSNTGTSSATSCDSYTWDGVVYTTSGVYSNTYTNASGCDSVHTLNLTINYSNTAHHLLLLVIVIHGMAFISLYNNASGCDIFNA